MLKILNTSQIREWDAFTIKNEPIASIDLMERACRAFVLWFVGRFDSAKKVGVICGCGNNGGDGLGIARLLHEQGYSVIVWIVKGKTESSDFKTNRDRLPKSIECNEIDEQPAPKLFADQEVLIDGIFGSGLTKPVEGVYAQVIEEINNSSAKKVAIDIPSGLFADKHTEGIVVHADYTISFQLPKLAFFFPENESRVGQWVVVDIELSKAFLKNVNASHFWIEKKWVAKKIPARKKFSHKGDFGKALLIAGSYGKMGACILSARAAMKSGVGLLTVHVPQCGYQIIQTAVPEAMATVDDDEKYFTANLDTKDFTAIGIGPGLGQHKKTIAALQQLLQHVNKPLVIDADGINIMAAHSSLLYLLPENTILTPHPGELHRLIGPWDDEFQRLEKVKSFANQNKCIVIVKGANSAIVSPDGKVYFNSTGNPGMATAGSGDALTGIITGLLAQGLNPMDAAIVAVYIHGFAGDLAAFEIGYASLMASDIINSLPKAFKQLFQ